MSLLITCGVTCALDDGSGSTTSMSRVESVQPVVQVICASCSSGLEEVAHNEVSPLRHDKIKGFGDSIQEHHFDVACWECAQLAIQAIYVS